jgi:zinc-ribbon domain
VNNQPQQRFCVNCGQPLTPGITFCTACGTQVGSLPANAQGQVPVGAQQVYHQPYTQIPVQAQDDPLLTGLAAGYAGSQMGRRSRQRVSQPRSRLRGYGCLLLFLVVLVEPFIGFALTKGMPHLIFTYLAGGLVLIFFLVVLIAMLVTRGGREALSEGCMDGCLDAILGGLLGGG